MRILIVDNEDSFTFNLVHAFARITGSAPAVVRNDWDQWSPAVLDEVDAVVISPGPGRPEREADFGISTQVIAEALRRGDVPLLGVCLGHQGLAYAMGSAIDYAPEPRHGRVSAVHHTGDGLFADLPNPLEVVRYHSLAVASLAGGSAGAELHGAESHGAESHGVESPGGEASEPRTPASGTPDLGGLPDGLTATAHSEDGVLMGMAHTRLPLWGVQFHPESILTVHGEQLLTNFVRLAEQWNRNSRCAEADGMPTSADASAAWSSLEKMPAPGPTETESEELLRVRRLRLDVPAEVLFASLFGVAETAVWLDGNMPGDFRARFSVMGAPTGPRGATALADVDAGTVTVTRQGSGAGGGGAPCTESYRSGFFDWLREELRTVRLPAAAAQDLPFDFALGWVGHLGYELKAECGGSAAHSAAVPDAALVFLDRALVLDHEQSEIYLLALEDPSVQDWLAVTETRIRELSDREAASRSERSERSERSVQSAGPAGPAGPAGQAESVTRYVRSPSTRAGDGPAHVAAASGTDAVLRTPLSARHSEQTYLAKVREAQRLIGEGETYEVCLTNMLELPAPAHTDAWEMYLALRRDNPAPFGAYLRFPGITVMSTSPERFLRVSDAGRAESSPIKGTRPRGATPVEDEAHRSDLLIAEKDRSENLMIVDLVRHDLGRTAAPGSVVVERLFAVESYATVHQLVSTVSAQLGEGLAPVDCVRAAFPPGSMTGAPKIRTMEIIDAVEEGPRGVYSGAIGYFSLTGAVDLSVVIRTLVREELSDGTARLRYGVGGAIVALSDPAEEYAETVVKAAPLLRLLGEDRF